MTTRKRLLTMALALAALLGFASSLFAQSGKPPRDPAAIQRKIQRSANLQRQALEALSEPGEAEKLAKNAWGQLKSAHDDLVMNSSNTRPPDPLLDLSTRKGYDALQLLQGAVDALGARDRRGDEAIATARDRLQQSLRITNTLAATGF